MLSFKSLLAAAVVASSALASASNQVALYWGQNGAGGQERLAQYCQETDVDIVLLSFLNLFPDPLNVNFANQCGNTFESGLLHCSQIGADIKTCQSLGKTVLLSLGGGVGDYGFSDAASATKFADTLWNKFGAGEDPERPFDDAVIDGFDFDIEHGSTTGYPELATALRSKFAKDSSKNYFLSAAPQCPYPDASLGDLLSKVPLDFAFIQFYNNYCSIDGQFNYDTWSKFADSAPNKNIKLFVGVPATSNIAGYVDTSKLSSAIEEIKCDSHFAGVSLWDASGAWLNTNDKGENFVVQVKNVLNQNACVAPISSATAQSTTTTSAAVTTKSNQIVTSSSSSSSSIFYGNSTTESSTGIATGTVLPTGSNENAATTGSGSNTKLAISTVTDVQKTVITITSCSEHKCVATPVTTGVVVVTDIDTVYTTYCPLTNSQVYVPVKTVVCTEEKCVPSPTSTAVKPKASTTTEGVKKIVTTSAQTVGSSTKYVTIELTSTITPVTYPTSVASNGTNTTVPVFTFEGGAAVANSLNSVWFTVPFLLAAFAF
ncbi:chitinase 2 [Candida albicans Ca6]|nr:chitinase 2 [Candida albicans P75063]KHC34752.1 chitinase 2 [Candida albicans Ca6]